MTWQVGSITGARRKCWEKWMGECEICFRRKNVMPGQSGLRNGFISVPVALWLSPAAQVFLLLCSLVTPLCILVRSLGGVSATAVFHKRGLYCNLNLCCASSPAAVPTATICHPSPDPGSSSYGHETCGHTGTQGGGAAAAG